MTTVHSGPAPLPWLVLRGLRRCWSDLPRALAGGAVVFAATVPFVVAVVVGAPAWLLAAATLPPALAVTGLAHLVGAIIRGERAAVRLDPVQALVFAAGLSAAGFGFAAGGPGAVAGSAVGAASLLVGPLALGYATVRGRDGLSALRGGLILAAYRPLWAVTLFGLSVLAFFAAAASAGVLAIAVVPLYLAIATSIVGQLLDEIDAAQRPDATQGRR
jgi:hypothetical protein